MIWRLSARAWLELSLVIAMLSPALARADVAVPPALPASASASNDSAASWSLRLPADGKVSYRGVVGFDQAGTGGTAMLYPAPNVVGLLVAVLTHGAIVEAAKNAQKEKMQTDANKVLSAYQDALNTFDSRELMRRVVRKANAGAGVGGRLIEQNDDPGPHIVVHSLPAFLLTQDQTAIVLENTIDIQMPGTVAASARQSTVRVVSAARDVEDPLAFWTQNNGEKLKDESAHLVAESLVIALYETSVNAKAVSSPYRTVRYREGAAEKIERAQVINTRCDRLLIRTLRGVLMSVPTSEASTEGCETVASDSK